MCVAQVVIPVHAPFVVPLRITSGASMVSATRAVRAFILAAVVAMCASAVARVAAGEVAARRHVHMRVLVLSAADEGDAQTLAVTNCLRAMGQPYTVVNVLTAFPRPTDTLNLVRTAAVYCTAGAVDGSAVAAGSARGCGWLMAEKVAMLYVNALSEIDLSFFSLFILTRIVSTKCITLSLFIS